MADEKDLFADLGAEFGTGTDEVIDVALEEESTVLSEDLEGFAKGFPSWDLLPPKK